MELFKENKIKNNRQLKQAFFTLAKETFHIDIQAWDELGLWDDNYRTNCIVHENEIVSNVSISNATLLVNGQTFRAKQIGTVMTAPQYRGLGYGKQLMQQVLTQYEQDDYIFLFANESSATFYEQFGFQPIEQTMYSMSTDRLQFKTTEIKKLNFNDAKTRAFILDYLIHRLPVSSKLGVLHNEQITMFNIMMAWQDNLYYLPAFQTIIVGRQQEQVFHLIDVISKQHLDLSEVVAHLNMAGAETIQFYFTPSFLKEMDATPIQESLFFVKMQCNTPFPAHYYFPEIAKA